MKEDLKPNDVVKRIDFEWKPHGSYEGRSEPLLESPVFEPSKVPEPETPPKVVPPLNLYQAPDESVQRSINKRLRGPQSNIESLAFPSDRD